MGKSTGPVLLLYRFIYKGIARKIGQLFYSDL